MASRSAASFQTAANRWTRSPDDTTSTPNSRISSIVPASTRAMYGIAQPGEYSIATRRMPGQQRGEAALELFASGVAFERAGQMRERVRFDRVNQRRAARRWPESGSTSAGSPDGRPGGRPPVTSAAIGIDAAEIVEQPAVEAFGAQRGLHGREIERRWRQPRLRLPRRHCSLPSSIAFNRRSPNASSGRYNQTVGGAISRRRRATATRQRAHLCSSDASESRGSSCSSAAPPSAPARRRPLKAPARPRRPRRCRPSRRRSSTSKSTRSSPMRRDVRPRPDQGRLPGLRGRQAADDFELRLRRHSGRAGRPAALPAERHRAGRRQQRAALRRPRLRAGARRLHTAALRSQLVKNAARQFIQRNLGANDLMAVVYTGGRTDASQEFTSNRGCCSRRSTSSWARSSSRRRSPATTSTSASATSAIQGTASTIPTIRSARQHARSTLTLDQERRRVVRRRPRPPQDDAAHQRRHRLRHHRHHSRLRRRRAARHRRSSTTSAKPSPPPRARTSASTPIDPRGLTTHGRRHHRRRRSFADDPTARHRHRLAQQRAAAVAGQPAAARRRNRRLRRGQHQSVRLARSSASSATTARTTCSRTTRRATSATASSTGSKSRRRGPGLTVRSRRGYSAPRGKAPAAPVAARRQAVDRRDGGAEQPDSGQRRPHADVRRAVQGRRAERVGAGRRRDGRPGSQPRREQQGRGLVHGLRHRRASRAADPPTT